MSDILNLNTYNWWQVIVAIFVLGFAFKQVTSLWDYVKGKLRIHFGFEDDKDNIKTELDCLRKKTEEQDDQIKKQGETLNRIDRRLLSMEISGMRKDILDMASTINSRDYNREHYSKIFATYSDYEHILEENNMENGYVEDSMQIIREKYKQKLANGDFSD